MYIDDMIVKLCEVEEHVKDLEEVFARIRKYDIRLNPKKCVFGVRDGKFLGFMLTNMGNEAILEMKSSTNLKEVHRLIERLIALARFLLVLPKDQNQ